MILFERVVNNFFTISLLILITLIFRFIIKKHSKQIMYYVWIFIFLKSSHLFNFEFNKTAKIAKIDISFINYKNTSVNDILYKTSTLIDNNVDIGFIVWFIGILILCVFFLYENYRLYKILRYSIKQETNIFESDKISVPFTFGIYKPKIYMPYNLDANIKKYIISHEMIHIKRNDNLIKFFSFIAVIINWINPFIWIAYFLFNRDIEYSCDELVTKNFNEKDKINYCKSILSFYSNNNLLCIQFSGGDTKSRIKNLTINKKINFYVIISCVLFSGVCLVLILSPTNYILSKCKVKDSVITCDKDSNALPKNISYIYPLSNPVISCDWECYEGDKDIDFIDLSSKNVLSVKSGTVSDIGFDNEIGNYIIINHGETSSLYSSIEIVNVEVGNYIKQGQIIGVYGSSGKSTGAHLGFAILNKKGIPIENTKQLLKFVLKTPINN